MKSIYLLTGFVFLMIWACHCEAQSSFVDGVSLTTVKAPWTIRIPGNDLDITDVQVRDDEESAYFMMTSASTKLNVSVFIEPVDKCKSGEECRDYVLGLGNPAWAKYEQLAKGKLKDFSYFEFYRPEVEGQPVRMLDMYAEYVSQGYWVDLHISKVDYTKADHALFEKVINSINFVPTQPSTSTFDVQAAKGQSAVTSWLSLWEKGKCKESFNALSSLTRADVTEQTWIDYCIRTNKDRGPNKARKLIGAAFTVSHSTKTARPLAILAYRSSFANEPVIVELIALVLEENGSWTISNYLLR